jgi:hypothetical protein
MRRELARKVLIWCLFFCLRGAVEARIDEIPCIFPANREFGFRDTATCLCAAIARLSGSVSEIWLSPPIVGSKESIEFAAKHDLPITPGLGRSRGLRDDIIRYYARCLARAGHCITPDHLSLGISAYVADSKAEAVREMGPYTSISTKPCSAMAISPRPNCSARPAIRAQRPPIT